MGNNRWLYPGFRLDTVKQCNLISFIVVDEIFRPIIALYKDKDKKEDKLTYWRYHMRANPNDSLGINVKLVIYTDKNDFDDLKKHMVEKFPQSLYKIIESDFHNGIHFDDCQDPLEEGETDERFYKIEGSSCRKWPPEIQKTFPTYIQYVCQTFLDLVEAVKERDVVKKIDKDLEYRSYYETLFDEVMKIWRDFG